MRLLFPEIIPYLDSILIHDAGIDIDLCIYYDEIAKDQNMIDFFDMLSCPIAREVFYDNPYFKIIRTSTTSTLTLDEDLVPYLDSIAMRDCFLCEFFDILLNPDSIMDGDIGRAVFCQNPYCWILVQHRRCIENNLCSVQKHSMKRRNNNSRSCVHF